MKQTRLSPRKWAFVVVAGGALLALPFTQRSQPAPAKQSAPSDLLANLEPTVAASLSPSQVAGDKPTASESESPGKLPAWAQAQLSPFDELMSQSLPVPSASPPEVVPLQPLRPWITPPPKKTPTNSESVAVASATGEGSLVAANAPGSMTPWAAEEKLPEDSTLASADHLVTRSDRSKSHLESVDAWPDERFPDASLVKHRPAQRQLQSAIVDPAQVLPGPSSQLATVTPPTLTRQGAVKSVAAPKVQFGQPRQPAPADIQPMTPLPDNRKSHVIFQPKR